VSAFPFKAVAAMSLNRVIGAGGRIPWHLPEDFKWFKTLTTGHVLVMGRKTFESIGKALPNRLTLVLSRTPQQFRGADMIGSLDEALRHPGTFGRQIFICGGAEIYALALPRCSDLYLTLVKREADGDTFFPPFERDFTLADQLRDCPDFTIRHYRRRKDADDV